MGPYVEKAIQAGVVTEEDMVYFQNFSMPGRVGEMSFNCPRITQRVKGYDVEDLTNAQVIGKQKIRRVAQFCRQYLPGFERAFISLTAPMVGIRESRRIVGEYVFSGDDVLNATKFDDAVARGNYPLDIHQPKKDAQSVEIGKSDRFQYYEIPYRTMVPLRIDNLLVVGRCISTTFEGQSAMRVQGIIRTMGEAAGYAAAVSIQDEVNLRRVNMKKVQELMRINGVKI
jgi:hypothetical protein